MRKSRYHYKRYFLPLPKAIGDLLDAKVEYVAQLFGPAIVYLPKGLENSLANFLSRLEKTENAHQENTFGESVALTDSLQEDSRIIKGND